MPVADFVIVCALQKERDAVIHQIKDPISSSKDGSYEIVNIYQANGQIASIAVVTLPQKGNVQAGISTTQAIMDCKPYYVILTGIVGGLESKNRQLGDVLIAEQVVGYEEAKIVNGQTKRRFKVVRPVFDLLMATFEVEKTQWATRIRIPRPLPPPTQCPKVHRGVVASGEKVVADRYMMTQLASVWHELIGVEMEAYGTMLATYQAGNRPGVLMVKGICDYADGSKNDIWHDYAADEAAAFTIALIESFLIDRSHRPLPQVGPKSGQFSASTGGSPHPDAGAVRFFRSCFHRPAFEVPYELEYSKEEFSQAIDDTVTALTTGCLRDRRDGTVLRKGPSTSDLQSDKIVQAMQDIVHILRGIRDDYRQAVRSGTIDTFEYQGSVYRRKGSPQLVHGFDVRRVEALERFNVVCAQTGVPPLTIVLAMQTDVEVETLYSRSETSEPRRTPEELARLGSEVFERRVRPMLRPEDDGKFVALDVLTGDYEVDEDDYAAVSRLRARNSAVEAWLSRVGQPAAYRMRRDR